MRIWIPGSSGCFCFGASVGCLMPIATLEDGVAERDIDGIFAEFASQLDRYKALARISHLELGLRTWQPAEPTPHRPVRPADVTKHPKVTPQVCHRIMRAYLEQVNSLQQVRQMSFVDLPSSQPTPKLQLPEGDFHVICSQWVALVDLHSLSCHWTWWSPLSTTTLPCTHRHGVNYKSCKALALWPRRWWDPHAKCSVRPVTTGLRMRSTMPDGPSLSVQPSDCWDSRAFQWRSCSRSTWEATFSNRHFWPCLTTWLLADVMFQNTPLHPPLHCGTQNNLACGRVHSLRSFLDILMPHLATRVSTSGMTVTKPTGLLH